MEDGQLWTILGVNLAMFVTLLGSIIVLFLWNRAEARADMRHILAIIEGIQKEMKDFHGRLCAIEERNKK